MEGKAALNGDLRVASERERHESRHSFTVIRTISKPRGQVQYTTERSQ
jgi:hypothetical protein